MDQKKTDIPFIDRHTERTIEQKAILPVLAAYEAAPGDDFPRRDQHGGKAQGQSLQAKKDFFAEAGPSGTISADWRMMTDNVSPMVKQGGTIVDVGGNSGRYAEFLARSRPDIKIIAIEPDPERFKLAQENLRKLGLEGRVTLVNKPVPEALDELRKSGTRVDMMTSIYRSHLQTDAENAREMKAMGELAKSTGASVVTHDLHRPESSKTIKAMTDIYPADSASHEFREGYAAGMRSAYRGAEMESMLKGNIPGQWEDRVARPLGQIQMHIMTGAAAAKPGEAPKPNYPPTSQEYIDVANDMNMILRMGGKADRFITDMQNAARGAQATVNSAIASAQRTLCENFSMACSATKPLDSGPERTLAGQPLTNGRAAEIGNPVRGGM